MKRKDTNLTRNIVAFRKNLIVLPKAESKAYRASEELVMSVIADLMYYGYIPTKDAHKAMSAASETSLIAFHDEVIDYLKEQMGGKGNFRSFWKNFPQSVMDKSEGELLLHMVINYWSGGAYEPNEFTGSRPTAYEKGSYTYFKSATETAFLKVFTDLVSVNQSLTPQDLDDVKWFANNVSRTHLPMPDKIPFKETLCTLAGLGLDVPVKSVTDVLRIAVGLSGGDISLPKVPSVKVAKRSLYRWSPTPVENKRDVFKFKKFSRPERKLILALLNKTNCDAREGVLKRERWLRLGEILHAGEYKNQFPKAISFFTRLRKEKVQSWYGEVDSAFETSFNAGLEKISERPAEFMRKLDALLRKNTPRTRTAIFSTLEAVGDKVSNKVLFENYMHFIGRAKTTERKIRVKGARKRTELKTLEALPETVVNSVTETINNVLSNKFGKLEPLGNVWIDKELKKVPLPSNMRSLSDALKPTVRGQRIKWDDQDARTIRAFLHFHKERTSITIDLSAIVVGDRDSFVIDWSHQKPKDNIVLHSGDSFGRIGDCAEYVDLNVEELVKAGYKYVLIQLNNYVNTPELENGNYFGIMARGKPEANRQWLPKTIENCMTVSVRNKANCAVIDLITKEYIPIDEDAGAKGAVQNASVNDVKQVLELVQPPVYSVYDLVTLHAKSRGTIVKNKKDADTKFEFKPFAESYIETLKLMGI